MNVSSRPRRSSALQGTTVPNAWRATLRRGRFLFSTYLLGALAASAADEVGQQLAENSQATIWCASSGWKIRPDLPVPTATAERAVVRAARNEAEAVQIVITPHANLSSLAVSVSAFAGPRAVHG